MSSLSDRLGSLNKDNRVKKEDKDEEDGKSDNLFSSEEYSLPKQVIIHRDERGYGLTVSGDNPVFVQSVKDHGAAARAGVQKGDRILKVNGSLVTKCNHKEVVKLIKTAGSYVALTLLGRPTNQVVSSPTSAGPGGHGVPGFHDISPVTPCSNPGNAPSTPCSDKMISGPSAVDPQMDKELKMQKVSMIRFMYEQACEECEKLMEEQRHNGTSPQLHHKLEEKLRLRGRLGDQLYDLTGIPTESHIASPKSPPSSLPPPGGTGFTPPAPSAQHRVSSKRYGDETPEGLNNISEDQELSGQNECHGSPPSATPWLPQGPRHIKTNSMPDGSFAVDVVSGVTVERSQSDRSRRMPPDDDSVDTPPRDPSVTASADEIEKLRTSSLPSSVYEAVSPSDPVGGATSPGYRDGWEDGADSSTYHTDHSESPNTTRGSGGLSPPRELKPHLQVVSPLQADIIPMEEEEEVNMDDEHLEDHGPFSDLNRLKHRSAHLAVFLHYLISNSDPSPLLFYLVTESYHHGSMKELRRWAYEIFSTFLVPSAPIKVEEVEISLLENIEQTLQHRSDKEDAMRPIFLTARHVAQKQISELLADYRKLRTLGLANLYGDNELSDNMEHAAEMKTVETKLMPHLNKCNRDGEKASTRDRAMASALATIMKNLGVTTGSSRGSTASLERCPTFNSQNKKLFKITGRSKKNGHQFTQMHYHVTTNCNYCRTILWGIGYQGFQCSNCEMNVHKSCMEQMSDHCRKKKEKRSSVFNMIRKTTNPNPAAIREAQRIHDDSAGHATGTSVFYIRPGPKDEEEEDLEQLRSGNKVTTLIDQYTQLDKVTGEDGLPPSTPPRGRSPDTMETEEVKRSSMNNLSRSESLNKKRESRRNVRRTRSDVQVDDQTLKTLNQSGSSSNSSLSNRSLDSPSTSAEALSDALHPGAPSPLLTVLQEDSDFETEPELPPLEASIPKEQLKKLRAKEKKRQDVLNELFYTERAHVRNLKVMHKIFSIPLMNAFNEPDMIQTLFPGLENLTEVHSKLNNRFKNARKDSCVVGKVADLLLSSFEGEDGEEFKQSCAKFCRDQSHALDYLRSRLRKDQKLANFLQEVSSNPLCRRLDLKDFIPQAMQRLTKYPLLIENLMKYTQTNLEEHTNLQRALVCAKNILSYVNQAVKERDNEHKLEDFQRRLDKRALENSSFQKFDLRNHRLIHDGSLTWRINKQKQIQLQVLLLDKNLVLLQKQDDRLVLKYQSTGRDDAKNTHSPIINLKGLMVRPVATDKHAMFLISDGEFGPQIYEFTCPTTDSLKRWFKNLSESTSDHRQRQKLKEDGTTPTGTVPRPVSMLVPETTSHQLSMLSDDLNTSTASVPEPDTISRDSLYSKSKSQSLDGLEKLDHVEVHSVNHSGLAQPSEVMASTVTVKQAHNRPSYTDQLREKESEISSALQDKRSILAEMLNVPLADYMHIAEVSCEVEGDKEPRELLLASLHQTDRLTCLVNSRLSPNSISHGDSRDISHGDSTDIANNNCDESEERERADSVSHRMEEGSRLMEEGSRGMEEGSRLMEEGSRTRMASGDRPPDLELSDVGQNKHKDVMLKIPSGELLDITAKLNAQLHALMVQLAERDKEQQQLKADFQAAQARVSMLLENQELRSPSNSVSHESRPQSYVSVTSSTSETGEVSEQEDRGGEQSSASQQDQHETPSCSVQLGTVSCTPVMATASVVLPPSVSDSGCVLVTATTESSSQPSASPSDDSVVTPSGEQPESQTDQSTVPDSVSDTTPPVTHSDTTQPSGEQAHSTGGSTSGDEVEEDKFVDAEDSKDNAEQGASSGCDSDSSADHSEKEVDDLDKDIPLTCATEEDDMLGHRVLLPDESYDEIYVEPTTDTIIEEEEEKEQEEEKKEEKEKEEEEEEEEGDAGIAHTDY